jgi:hypothetical protein
VLSIFKFIPSLPSGESHGQKGFWSLLLASIENRRRCVFLLNGGAALNFLGREIKMGKRVAAKGNAISYHVKNQNVIGV